MGLYDNDGNQPRRNWWGRLVGAGVIALIGYLLYLSQSQVNPITGEKQHVSMSPNQEISLGLQSAPQMAQEMGGEVASNDPRVLEVQEIGNFLVENTEAKKSPWQFQFHLLKDSETINAFALPGGQIFITLGLYDKLQNQAQLAGVLSHEMGHVIERHTAEHMAKSQLGQFLVIAFGTGVGSSGGQQSGQDPTMIAQMVNQMIQLRFSRSDESEADTWGLKLMEEVGYDPNSMIDVMNILKKASGSGGGTPEIFQTHPNPDLRIERIQAYLKEHPPRAGLSKGKPLNRGRVSLFN